jgi:response regulator receiver protein
MNENKKGKIITVTSAKGGVGKTIFLLNLAGIFSRMKQKVLIVDCDLVGGAVALDLNLNPIKNIFHISDDIFNNRYQNYTDYLTSYQDNIDIVASCKDPKQALKIDMNYIMMFLKQVKNEYDIILVDTTHGFTKENINILDKSDIILYMMTNDIMDIKNTKSYMEVMNDIEMDHIKIILNNSRDINLNYFSKYDIRSMIGRNIDYSLDRSLYIKNITSFLIEGEIFTLNKSLTFKDKNDLKKLENMARDFIEM